MDFLEGYTHATNDVVLRFQRTAKGDRYQKWSARLREILDGRTEADREKAKRINQRLVDGLRRRGVQAGEVHSDTFMSSLSVQYANDEYIGIRLMPIVPVSKRSDRFAVYPKKQRFAFPNDAMGDRSRANELDESRTFDNYSVKDYGLQNFVDVETVNNQDAPFNEMMDLVEAINEGIAFNEEKRIATILTTAGNYAGNTITLAGANQWSAGSGDPVKNIQDALAAQWMGRGPTERWMFSSLEVYNVLARHPAIRDLFKYVGAGLAMPQAIAGYFGCAGYLIGAAREDTANEGQTASYSRIWGKHFGVVRVPRRATLRSAFFGATMRLSGDPITTQWFDPAVGKQGGNYAKVGLSEDHKIIAGDTGYLIVDAVA